MTTTAPIAILIVEDTLSILRLYSHVLRQSGYVVLEATSGSVALEKIRTYEPDIVLLDRVLPDMDGSEIGRRIKADPATAATYVIMLSALKTTEDDRVSGLEAGADDYIIKPVGKRELLARIQVAARLRHAQRALQASEAKLRRLVQSSQDGIILVDGDGAVVEWNPGQEAIVGIPRAEVLGQPIWTVLRRVADIPFFFATGDDELQGMFLQGTVSTGAPWLQNALEFEIRRPDGIRRIIQTLAFPIQAVSGIMFGGITRDVTDEKQMQEAIRRREQEFRTLAENAPDIICRIDRNHRFRYVNPAVDSMFHLPPESVVGKATHELGAPPNVVAQWNNTVSEVLASGKDKSITFELPVDGQPHMFDMRVTPEVDRDGNINSVLAITRDFTDHHKAEQEVARMATVVEQAVEAVTIIDNQGTILYVNQAMERLAGFSSAALVGRTFEAVHTNCPETSACHHFADALTSSSRWEGITQCRRSDGTLCDIETSIFPVRDKQGSIINYAAIQRDVTERRRSEQEREVLLTVAAALRAAETRQSIVSAVLNQVMELLDVVGAALITDDADTRDCYIESVRSDGSAQRREFPADRQIQAGSVNRNGADIFTQGRSHAYVNNHVRPGEFSALGIVDERVQAIAAVPLITQDQTMGVLWIASDQAIIEQAVGILLAIADISANALYRVALYDELQGYAVRLEQHVAERTAELRAANEQLLELDRLKSKFVSNVSHELRTPISNLKLYMHLLQRGKPDKRAHYEGMLNISVERLGQLVEDILSLSRVEIAHYQPRELEPTDLDAIIRQIVTLHQPQADAAGVRLTYDSANELPLIPGDFNQLSQLVTNLVVNALNYTPHGFVRVSTCSDEKQVVFRVEDSGVGILAEDLPHIFERFYRGNHDRMSDIPGTGLGLAIVKEIVDIHHGAIDVKSEIDIGTRFEVRLPRPPGNKPLAGSNLSAAQIAVG